MNFEFYLICCRDYILIQLGVFGRRSFVVVVVGGGICELAIEYIYIYIYIFGYYNSKFVANFSSI